MDGEEREETAEFYILGLSQETKDPLPERLGGRGGKKGKPTSSLREFTYSQGPCEVFSHGKGKPTQKGGKIRAVRGAGKERPEDSEALKHPCRRGKT